MAIVINGSGTVTGLAVGGLPDGTVDAGTLATDSVTAAKIATNSVDSAELIDGAVDRSHLATGIDDNSNATAITINSSEQVGIGQTSPAALLHLKATLPEIRFTYTGNSGYSYIKGGADNDLTFSTGTTTGTERMELTGAGILNQFSSTAIQAGVNNYVFTGGVNTSTSSFYVDVDVGNSGGGNVALVEAIYSHHGLSSYGCALMGWYVFYNGGYQGENTISDITSGNGGSWSVSGPANGTMRVTKNAGSYAGGGEWFVKVTTQVR